ncbi:snRNA-activating protein complex subunit 1-like [Ornithodoros turicata]
MRIGPVKKIAAGFPTDMSMLLDRFVVTNSVRYEGFAKLWREAKFPLIFCGRKDLREMRQFIDETFSIILQLWVPTSNFQEKVFALYMLYGMYTMQPITPKVKIRIKMNHWAMSQELLQQSAKEQHLDICYIIHRMRQVHSFHFVAFLKLRSPALLAEKEEENNSISEMTMKVYSNMHDMMKGGLLEQLSLIHNQYTCMRSMQDTPSVSQLDMVRQNIFEDLGREVSKLQAKYKVRLEQEKDDALPNPAGDSDDDSDTSNVGTRRKRLRQRQFAKTSQTRKGRRYDELVIDEDADDNTSPDVADKRSPQCKRSRKDAPAKAKSATAKSKPVTAKSKPAKSKPVKAKPAKAKPAKAKPAGPSTNVEKESVGPQKVGRSRSRPTKSKMTAAASSENVATGNSTDNASAEAAAPVGDAAQRKPQATQKKRGSGRPKKSAESSR